MRKRQPEIKILSARNQILTRPTMWIGGMDNIEHSGFLFKDNHLEYASFKYIPALLKIINEILDNSIDAINNAGISGKIDVNIDDKSVTVTDNGHGIPIIKKDISEIDASLPEETRKKIADTYLPETCWCQLFTGSNFSDDDKTTIGSHGVGSKATAIFSTKFIGTTMNNGNKCTVTAERNLETVNTAVSKCKKKQSGTSVVFYPDLARFKLDKIEQVYKDLILQRLTCLSVSFPNITFSFNGYKVKFTDKSFTEACSDKAVFTNFNNGFIAALPNAQDEFNFLTYVNGLHLSRGGSHIDYISNEVVARIREKLIKRFKSIRPGDIKQKLTFIVFLKDFKQPKYDSQTKETLTNSIKEVSSQLADKIDFDEFCKQLLKSNDIIDPIIETFKIKEELKARQEIKRVKRIKISADKYMTPIGKQERLFLTEGLSAQSSISACLGREGNAYYACRGVGINAYSQSIQKISGNAELKDIVSILELDMFGKQEKKEISFDKVVIATDADVDGSHITSMFIGWFKRFAPNLFSEGKICKLVTPLVLLKDKSGKIKKYFYKLNEFTQWEANNQKHTYKVEYLKGLGSIEKKDLDFIIEKEGFDGIIKPFNPDEGSDKLIDDWLNTDATPRKEYLRQYTLNINQI